MARGCTICHMVIARRRTTYRFAAAVVSLVILTAACASSTASDSRTGEPAALEVPDFSSTLIDGTPVSLAEKLAGRPVALWFWAPGCSTCNAEAPTIEATAKMYVGDVTVLGVAWNGTTQAMHDFEVRHGLTFTSVNDADGKIFEQFGVAIQPAWVFIAQDGSMTTRLGAIDEATLEAELQKLGAL